MSFKNTHLHSGYFRGAPKLKFLITQEFGKIPNFGDLFDPLNRGNFKNVWSEVKGRILNPCQYGFQENEIILRVLPGALKIGIFASKIHTQNSQLA